MKRITAILLAAMLLCLAACGSAAENNAGIKTAGTDAQPMAKSGTGANVAEESGLVEVNYRAAEITLPEELNRVEEIAMGGNKLYAAGMDTEPQLFAMNMETEDWEQMGAASEEADAESPEIAAFQQIMGLAATEERAFLLTSRYEESGASLTLAAYDGETRELLGKYPIEGMENEYFKSFFAVGDKLLAHTAAGTLYIFSQEGQTLSKFGDEYDAVAVVNGRVIAGKAEEQSEAVTLYELNTETAESTALCQSEGSFDASYVSESDAILPVGRSVYKVNLESGEREHLFDWGDTGAGILLTPDAFLLDADGNYFIADSFANALYRIHYFEGEPRRELIIGCGEGVTGTYLTKAIAKFNASNTEYLAREKVYKQEEADKILTELIAGKGPDVLFLGSSLDRESAFTRVKVDKGLCVDLMPYLENDPDVSPEDFVPGVLESMTEDGQLYKLAPSFTINTVAAPKALAEEIDEWIPEALRELTENLPEGTTLFNTWERRFFMEDICKLASVRFVDRADGSCSFDSGEFALWLELCRDMEYMGSGTVESAAMLEGVTMPGMASYFRRSFGDDYEFIGYPSAEGGVSFFSGNVGGFSILRSSTKQDGAWEFIKTLLTPEVQEVLTAFENPAIESSFDKMLEKQMKNENSDFTEEDMQKYRDAVAKSRGRAEGDAVTDIIKEEAEKYFSGQKTLEDTVAMIQSKAGIYLAEQKG